MPILSKPEGATIHIDGKLIGIAPVSFRVEGVFNYFVATCLKEGRVSCGKETMFSALKTKDVARWWWDFTDEQRKTLAVWIIDEFAADTINYIRSGKTHCEGGEGIWEDAVCFPNALVRWLRLGEVDDFIDDVSCCYWAGINKKYEYCFNEFPLTYPLQGVFKGCFGLPVYPVMVQRGNCGHYIVAIQISKSTQNFNSWLFFQYGRYPTPGNWQIPCGTSAEDTVVEVQRVTTWEKGYCGSFLWEIIAKWRIDKECKITPF